MGTLYIVATPIGNLGDLSTRAAAILGKVSVVLAEDTRVTRTLLEHVQVTTPLRALHQHSGPHDIRAALEEIQSGCDMALVTDAGTPAISDPGYALVDQAHLLNIPVVAVPGPSAVTAALSLCGFPADRYTFYGFLPQKKRRTQMVQEVASVKHTVVLYESNHRIHKLLEELRRTLSENRMVCVCRELTKRFESTYRAPISQLSLEEIPAKGEFVIVIGPDTV